MEKLAQMALLLDIYGKLLTPRQRDVMDLYYNYDLSLGEIAQANNISRQGVYDLIKRGEQALYNLDKKLCCYKQQIILEDRINDIIYTLDYISQLPDQDFVQAQEEVKNKLIKVKQQLLTLLDI
jgi:predicted DNA-binding protein YlxM (UPF0122 family)